MIKNNFFAKERNLLLADKSSQISMLQAQGLVDLALTSSSRARQALSFKDACKYEVLPIGLKQLPDGRVLTLACQSDSEEIKQNVAFLTSMQVELLPLGQQNIKAAIFKAYKSDAQILLNKKQLLRQEEQGAELSFLNELFEFAVAKHASDIHIIPTESGGLVKIRVNGELYHHPENIFNCSQYKRTINRIKVLANLNLSEARLPQDGNLKITVLEKQLSLRVSLMPTTNGEKAVLRLPQLADSYSLEELGFNPKTMNLIKQSLQQSSGLILFCGPTGSGKTSSLYAAAYELLKYNQSIVSIEDPVEVSCPGIEQTSLQTEIGLDYPRVLKSMLRQDPDVIMLGEIRDSESAEVVLQAALTGHLIISTVHTANVFEVVSRLLDFGLNKNRLTNALNLIVNQRLLPLLCGNCKQKNGDYYSAKACKYCNQGYLGRQIVTESLQVDSNMREKLVTSIHSFDKRSKNYYSMRKQLEDLLQEGKIDYLTYKNHL